MECIAAGGFPSLSLPISTPALPTFETYPGEGKKIIGSYSRSGKCVWVTMDELVNKMTGQCQFPNEFHTSEKVYGYYFPHLNKVFLTVNPRFGDN